MTLDGVHSPVSLDPLIAEAKQRMRRRRLLVLVVLAVVVAATMFALLPGGSATTRPFRKVAPRQARQLLDQLVLPPGAQRVRVAPHGDGGLLHGPASTPGAMQLVDLHRIWRVHKSFVSTPSFVQLHLPSSAKGEGRGAAGGPGVPYNNEDDSYSFPTSDGVDLRWLTLDFVRLHGWTYIRADAQIGKGITHH